MQFYENPGSPWVTENSTQELEDAGVIIKTRVTRPGTFCAILSR